MTGKRKNDRYFNIHRFRLILLIHVLFLIIAFLHIPQQVFCQEDRPRPQWVDGLPFISTRIEGVGMSSSFSDPDSNIFHAKENARLELAKYLQVSIMSETVDSTIYKRTSELETLDQSFRQNIRSKAHETLNNCFIGDIWYDKKQRAWWAYAYIERDDFTREMAVHRRSVVRYYRNGKARENDGEIAAALREYVNGLRKTYGIHTHYIEAEIDGSLENLRDLMQRSIDDCLSKINVTFISPYYSGEYGLPLENELVVRVAYGARENKRYLRNIPVIFEYLKGQGILSVFNIEGRSTVSGTTDQNGEITCTVSAILSVTNENILSAIVNLQQIFGTEWSSFKNRFSNNLGSQYVYASRFLPGLSSDIVISINGSSDEQVVAEGQQAEVKISLNDICRVTLFLISAQGEISCILSGITREETGENHVIERIGDRWVFTFKTTFNADAGEGVETIVCITTPVDFPLFREDTRYTKNEIVNLLQNQVDRGNYHINCLSYVIKK